MIDTSILLQPPVSCIYHNECPCMLLCLVYCVGRAQSCFLIILRIPSALLTRLAPASCTLHPELYHPCICAYSFAPRYNINLYSYRAHAHALHATTSSCAIVPTAAEYAPHNLCIPAATPGTSAMRRHARACAYNTHVHMHNYMIAHAHPIFICI